MSNFSGLCETLRVLRKTFTPRRKGVTGDWRKLHSEELPDRCSSENIQLIKSLRIKWAGHVALVGKKRNTDKILVGKPDGNKQLGRPRRIFGDNIKMDLKELGYEDVDWICLIQSKDKLLALVSTVLNMWVA